MTAPLPAAVRARADRAVRRSRRIEGLIPTVLLDSPISLVGFWWGTFVGATWGWTLSRGRVERHGRLIVFRGLPGWAYPRGGVCVGRCFLTGDEAVTPAIIRHESVHVAQWRRFGFLMPLMYTLAGRQGLTNRFEIEAGLRDGRYL